MPRLSAQRAKTLPYLLWMLLLVPMGDAFAQNDADRRADSIMRDRDDLFVFRVPDSLDESTIDIDTSLERPDTWIPEFSPRFMRRDMLGLRDRHFFLTYDRADGLFLGAGADLPRSVLDDHRLQGHFGFGYALGSHYWQVSGGLRRDLLEERTPLRIGIEGHIVTDTRDAWKMDLIENTLYALFAGGDARDYFQRRGFSVSVEQYLHPRISVAAEYRHDTYRSSRREVGFSIFGPEQPFRDVPSIIDGPLRSFAITLVADGLSLRNWNEPQLGIAIEAEFGSGADSRAPDGSDRDFSMQSFTADARLKTTIIPGALWLAVRGRAGATIGSGAVAPDGPRQRWFSLGGVGTLPGYPDNEFVGNRMLLLNSDVLIRPIASGVGRNLRIIISNDVGTVVVADQEDRDNAFALGPPSVSDWEYSPGIYLGSPAGRFRIGAAWRTDRMESPRFVLRLSEVF